MSKIAVLGLGAMGSRMAGRLITAGHSVSVWNRSPAAARSLVELGASWVPTPREAAQSMDFVIAMVRDDQASQSVWLDPDQGALAGMASGAVAIESSTLTPRWVRELGARSGQHGVELLEAPVSGSRVQADTGQLSYLVGGLASTLERAQPVLKDLGSNVSHVGALGDGALAKLVTNAMLGLQVAGFAEIIVLLRRNGADPTKVLAAMAGTSVWPPIAAYLSGTMLSGNFAPQFPVELMTKDLGYVLNAAGSQASVPTIAAVRGVFEAAVAQGLGAENMTSVAKLFG